MFLSVILPTLSKRAASCLHSIFNDCHSSYDKLLDNINRPSLHNYCRIHDMLTLALVYKYFYGLALSYINELLIETNSSHNLRGKYPLSIPRVQSTKIRTPFATLPENIGICSQRYLELLSHYMFLNQKLRALALIINAACFATSSNYH